jgi:hypothetical protein
MVAGIPSKKRRKRKRKRLWERKKRKPSERAIGSHWGSYLKATSYFVQSINDKALG